MTAADFVFGSSIAGHREKGYGMKMRFAKEIKPAAY
jgi:hypothetical protein